MISNGNVDTEQRRMRTFCCVPVSSFVGPQGGEPTSAVDGFGGRLFGLDAGDRAALFYCGSTKSLASGLPIATALFAAEAVGAIVLPLMIYHMLQLLVCAFLAQKAVVAPAA